MVVEEIISFRNSLISRALLSTNFLNLNFWSFAPSNFFALANPLSTYCLWQEIRTPCGVEIWLLEKLFLFRNSLISKALPSTNFLNLNFRSFAPFNFFALANHLSIYCLRQEIRTPCGVEIWLLEKLFLFRNSFISRALPSTNFLNLNFRSLCSF